MDNTRLLALLDKVNKELGTTDKGIDFIEQAVERSNILYTTSQIFNTELAKEIYENLKINTTLSYLVLTPEIIPHGNVYLDYYCRSFKLNRSVVSVNFSEFNEAIPPPQYDNVLIAVTETMRIRETPVHALRILECNQMYTRILKLCADISEQRNDMITNIKSSHTLTPGFFEQLSRFPKVTFIDLKEIRQTTPDDEEFMRALVNKAHRLERVIINSRWDMYTHQPPSVLFPLFNASAESNYELEMKAPSVLTGDGFNNLMTPLSQLKAFKLTDIVSNTVIANFFEAFQGNQSIKKLSFTGSYDISIVVNGLSTPNKVEEVYFGRGARTDRLLKDALVVLERTNTTLTEVTFEIFINYAEETHFKRIADRNASNKHNRALSLQGRAYVALADQDRPRLPPSVNALNFRQLMEQSWTNTASSSLKISCAMCGTQIPSKNIPTGTSPEDTIVCSKQCAQNIE